MKNFIVSIPATIDFEVQAQCRHELLPAIKEVLADFGYAIDMDVTKYNVTDEWDLRPGYQRT